MAERALVVVPTYNEAVNLPLIVPQILAQDPRLDVLVVDDNSPDGTGPHGRRDGRGRIPGSTCCTGRRRPGWGRPTSPDSAGRWSGTTSSSSRWTPTSPTTPSSWAMFLEAAKDADLVIGSRYRTGVNVINWPISRLLLSLGANQYARWITGLPIVDSTGGFKCFRRRVLEAIDFDQVRSNGYSFQIEMSFRAWKKGFRLVEIPIVFTDRVEGQSKMNKRIVREAIWMVWWLRLKSLVGQL